MMFRRLTLALMLVAGMASLPARAQEGGEVQDEGPDLQMPVGGGDVAPPPGIEAIEVTGERLDTTDVQDQASAISAFSGADLDRASIVSVDSLQFNVPGLHVGQSGTAPIITLRGIGTENASLTGEPGVAFHIDGLNMARPSAARVAFFDLETLDVKRGPQGLLGGKNSTSGSINLVSNKPTDEFEFTSDVLSGNFDRIRYRGAVNFPLPIFGEGSAARFAYFHEDRDGYLDDVDRGDKYDPFDTNDRGLRAHFKWAPSDTFEWLFSYNYFTQGGAGPQSDAVPQRRENLPCSLSYPVAVQRTLGGKQFWSRTSQPVFTTTDLVFSAACFSRRLATPSLTVPGWVEPNLGATNNGTTVYRDPKTNEILIDPLSKAPIPISIRQGTNPDGSKFTRYLTSNINVFAPASEDTDPRELHLDTPAEQDNKYWGWSTAMDWDVPEIPLFGETHLKLLGGWQSTGGALAQDFDATDAAIVSYTLDDESKQWTTELQWSGLLAERLEWQTSLFYLHEKASRDVALPNLVNPQNRGIFTLQTTNNKSYGAALNGIYSLTDDLRFSLGGRFIKDRKETWMERYDHASEAGDDAIFRGCEGDLSQIATGGPNVYPYFGERARFANNACSQIARGMMWGAGIDWRPFGGDHLLYAKIDRGYKSGGFQAGTIGLYAPEKIWAYAAGTKSEFFDQRLTLNLEGFFYAYQDLQLVIIDGFALRTENTDARMHGFDVEAQATPLDGLTLGAIVSFLKTEALDYNSLDPTLSPPSDDIDPALWSNFHGRRLLQRESAEALERSGSTVPAARYANRLCFLGYTLETSTQQVKCGTTTLYGGLDDFSGNQLPRSPEWKLTLSAEYEIPLGRFGSLIPRVQYTWQDDTYFRAFNQDFDLQEAHHMTNAKLIWRSPEERWSLEAFVENIEDETPKQNILIGPRGIDAPPFAWYGAPRFYGFQVGYRY